MSDPHPSAGQAAVQHYDVVVVGAGAGGGAAAISAARMGARTLLIERHGFMGGAATHSHVLAYCGFYQFGGAPRRMVRGVGQQVLDELQGLGVPLDPIQTRSGAWIVLLDVEATKYAFDRLIVRNRVQVELQTQLVAARVEDGMLRAITVADYRGLREISAGAFVDASGHACLAAFAGVPLTQAGDGHLQPSSLPVRVGQVAPDTQVDRELLRKLIAEYNATAEERIAREDGGVLYRLPLTGDYWWMAVDLACDGVSGADLARAEMAARASAWRFLPVLRRHPGFERATLLASGPQLGIRESRRPQSLRDVTEADALAGRRDPQGIARAAWPMEVHHAPGRVQWVPVGGDGYFDVPHGALMAHGVRNLRLAGRVIGADARAYASVRVMGTAFATGQAAGVSAALAARGDGTDAAMVERVRAELLRHDAML